MAGYSIELFKFMKIDENFSKKDRLLSLRKNINRKDEEETAKDDTHIKYYSYGEFARISFKEIKRFSKFRDVPEEAKNWIGDRQTLFIYDIDENSANGDSIFYREDAFREKGANGLQISEKLFVGITMFQFKDSQEKEKKIWLLF